MAKRSALESPAGVQSALTDSPGIRRGLSYSSRCPTSPEALRYQGTARHIVGGDE